MCQFLFKESNKNLLYSVDKLDTSQAILECTLTSSVGYFAIKKEETPQKKQ